MISRLLPIALAVAVQPALLHAQRLEPGTGYWYEGIVTHERGAATVASNEPRPLRQAVEALAEEYGWTVDYEDPIYTVADGLERTEAGFVASHPGIKQHLVAGHRFHSEYPEDTATRTSPAEEKAVLQKVIADYNKSANPGKFRLLDEGGGRFAVVGAVRGSTAAQTAILDSPITVDVKETNGSWAMSKICDGLTAASGAKFQLAQYPLNVLVRTQVSLHTENESARDVLRAVLARAPQKLMWSVLYDIDDEAYYLNLIPVVEAGIAPTGERTRKWAH